jgi:glycerophosphoryl diester phosphodiesterase
MLKNYEIGLVDLKALMTLDLLKSKTGRTLIESHRGVVGDVPENSWPAIQLGHQLGADLIEVDVQMSQDSILFLRHNYQLPDGRWGHDVPWDELKEIRIEGEPLPKLEDVLVWARDVGMILSLDIKNIFHPYGGITKKVIRLLERTNTKNSVLLLFIDHPELFQAKLVHPELTVRALLSGRLMHYRDYLQKIRADCVSLMYGMFRSEDVEDIHAAGISVVLGGLWNPDTDLFRSIEIDVFNYGNPAEARKILNHLQKERA